MRRKCAPGLPAVQDRHLEGRGCQDAVSVIGGVAAQPLDGQGQRLGQAQAAPLVVPQAGVMTLGLTAHDREARLVAHRTVVGQPVDLVAAGVAPSSATTISTSYGLARTRRSCRASGRTCWPAPGP